jgi:hypothetical protein
MFIAPAVPKRTEAPLEERTGMDRSLNITLLKELSES